MSVGHCMTFHKNMSVLTMFSVPHGYSSHNIPVFHVSKLEYVEKKQHMFNNEAFQH